MRIPRVAVVGAGVAGLTAAIDLAGWGFDVTLFERALTPGGKLREVSIDGIAMDAGPTVFTLRRVFDELFDDADDNLDSRIRMTRATVLARHAWTAHERLDLFADVASSTDAIGAFAGPQEAAGFMRFAADAQRIYTTLDHSFMRAVRPSVAGLVRRVGLGRSHGLWNIQPFTTLWRAAGGYFKDARLRQLFSRYATYCGSSPFASPATLMLVAHAEQAGVWYLEGGMFQLATQLAALAERRGATLRYGSEIVRMHLDRGRISAVQTHRGERVPVDAVVCNADTNALASGIFGDAVRSGARHTPLSGRSLSAITWNLVARTEGFDLAHHSVFFSADYRAEFDDIFRRRRIPRSPTIYICAQDRGTHPVPQRERLLCLVNAPPTGDRHSFDTAEIDACTRKLFSTLANFGLVIHGQANATTITSPSQFNQLYPATGGALYGPASHGWMASFKRTGSRSPIPGLYLAGGSSHPGPGVPMAATSGRLAAAAVAADYASIVTSRRRAMRGGMSTH